MDERATRAGSGAPSTVKSYGAVGRGSASGSRTRVALACTECDSRNYQTTRKADQQGQLTLKKFCPRCNKHTVHKETK
jgi:large subunit ribosomal protein L33